MLYEDAFQIVGYMYLSVAALNQKVKNLTDDYSYRYMRMDKGGNMNHRERVRAIFSFKTPDRLPVWQLERVIEGAVRKWYLEGLPIEQNVTDYLGIDRPIRVPLDFEPIPRFVERTIAEDEESKTVIDEYGLTVKLLKGYEVSPWRTRHDLDTPVKTREDWNRYKKLLDPHDIRRYPKNWGPELFEHYRTTTDPVSVFFNWGPGRGVKGGYMLGVVPWLESVHDNPAFLEDIFDFWADFSIEVLRPLLEAVPVDFIFIEEDGLGYKNSTLVSPKTYRALWLPHQRRVVDFIRSKGVKTVGYRSSGNMGPLIPCLLEAGFNMHASLECAAGADAIQLRKQYGRDLILVGNIAREAFMGDRATVEKEFYSKVPWLVEQGGYLPTPDDAFMPDWPLDTVLHYTELVRNFVVK